MKKVSVLIVAAMVSMGAIANSASASVFVNGYFKSNGTYVMPHFRSSPDGFYWNNYSSWD